MGIFARQQRHVLQQRHYQMLLVSLSQPAQQATHQALSLANTQDLQEAVRAGIQVGPEPCRQRPGLGSEHVSSGAVRQVADPALQIIQLHHCVKQLLNIKEEVPVSPHLSLHGGGWV